MADTSILRDPMSKPALDKLDNVLNSMIVQYCTFCQLTDHGQIIIINVVYEVEQADIKYVIQTLRHTNTD